MLFGEIPLNSIVLRLIGAPEILNTISASIIGFLLLWIAHVVGAKLKYYRRTLKDWISIGTTLFVVLVALAALAILREHYLRAAGEISVAETSLTYAFVVVQFMIFWGAVVAAYAYHEPATINDISRARDSYVFSSVMMAKMRIAYRWEARAWRKSMNRRKDVYIGANLEHRGKLDEPPAVFQIVDFDDEQVISTPVDLK